MSKKRTSILLSAAFSLFAVVLSAQEKYYTKDGKISFNGSTDMENIEANNKGVVAVLDIKTGELQFAVLMKGFEFKKALMQEHFNTDYVESDKFPKAEFKGQINNNAQIDYTKNGSFTLELKGSLTIHGEIKEIKVNGTITIKDEKIFANSTFNVLLADYNIIVPRTVRDLISKSIKVTVDCTLVPLKN